jgi:hypothetical protein
MECTVLGRFWSFLPSTSHSLLLRETYTSDSRSFTFIKCIEVLYNAPQLAKGHPGRGVRLWLCILTVTLGRTRRNLKRYY